MEAKFVSHFEATSHCMWLKNLISKLRVMNSISRPLRIFYDNLVVVFMDKNKEVVVEVSTSILSS